MSALGNIWRAMIAAAPLRQWWQAGAAMALTLFAAGVVVVLWLGPWSPAVEAKRVDGLVLICLAVLFIVLVAIVAMNDLNLNLRASKAGLDASIAGEGTAPQPVTVTTTTATTVQPAAEPEAAELPPGDRVQR